jgi:hypothetical protein
MTATHFSGPVVSDSGFTGNVTGNVTGDTTGTHYGAVNGGIIAGNLMLNMVGIADDGAIVPTGNSAVVLGKNGVGAYTITNPTALDAGTILLIFTTTAQAHVITNSTSGFNNKGSSGTITFTAAIGNSCMLIARSSKWYVVMNNGVTVA